MADGGDEQSCGRGWRRKTYRPMEEKKKKKKQKVKMRDETYRHIAIRDSYVANKVQTDMAKIEKQQPRMRMTNIYRLNEVLHRLIKKKA